MEQFLTTNDVSKLLKLGQEGVRYLNRTGKLSAIRTLGGMRLYRLSEVMKLAKERSKRAQSVKS